MPLVLFERPEVVGGCMRAGLFLGAGGIAGLLSACVPMEGGQRIPEALVMRANVGEFRDVRFFADDIEGLRALADDRIRAMRRAHPGQSLKGRQVDIHYLALSGGAGDGAFGAGLLSGWTAAGTRPNFDVVTGISTGALIAPFAFLGPAYDEELRQAYTTLSTKDIEDNGEQPLPAVLGLSDSLTSTHNLESIIARHITPQLLEAIGQEYGKGRLLLIGTTNLDAQRPVIWDIGAIAATGRPESIDLIRKIIRASAAIPGLFPPVRLNVEADGKSYDEWHVDGGVTRQVFLFPPGYTPDRVDKALGWRATRHAYIIRNGKITAQYEAVKPAMLDIANRSISTLIKTQGIGDLFRIYTVCQRFHIDYNVAFIPAEFQKTSASLLDPDYMRDLFEFGYRQAAVGYAWHKEPPGFEPRQ
jgi:hypothetical protein